MQPCLFNKSLIIILYSSHHSLVTALGFLRPVVLLANICIINCFRLRSHALIPNSKLLSYAYAGQLITDTQGITHRAFLRCAAHLEQQHIQLMHTVQSTWPCGRCESLSEPMIKINQPGRRLRALYANQRNAERPRALSHPSCSLSQTNITAAEQSFRIQS
jgi:hypothetical protein